MIGAHHVGGVGVAQDALSEDVICLVGASLIGAGKKGVDAGARHNINRDEVRLSLNIWVQRGRSNVLLPAILDCNLNQMLELLGSLVSNILSHFIVKQEKERAQICVDSLLADCVLDVSGKLWAKKCLDTIRLKKVGEK